MGSVEFKAQQPKLHDDRPLLEYCLRKTKSDFNCDTGDRFNDGRFTVHTSRTICAQSSVYGCSLRWTSKLAAYLSVSLNEIFADSAQTQVTEKCYVRVLGLVANTQTKAVKHKKGDLSIIGYYEKHLV